MFTPMDTANKKTKKSITTRAEDYSEWYLDVIEAAELAEHSPVKGSMVIKPYGYAIWEMMQGILDKKFKEKDVQNAYFPLFIPESFLHKEAKHVAGFAPETAVVTHAGGKKLAEPLIVRPTSETIIYDTYSRWIQSYRDLPLLINQWANVVRWELRPRLFLRTTEFLWQEGHTAHATNEEADQFARSMLDVYRDFAENVMAIPVIPGRKSPSERFAGAAETYTIEAMMQDGKALQAGTSHNLGQNFSKAFDVQFLNTTGKKEYVWQTSWGVSTRLIGGLIMTHSDDKGLVLPPNIAPTQVVIIPIWKTETEKASIEKVLKKITDVWRKENIRYKVDTREHLRPGEKFFYWEKRGVPIRIEIGPKDIANKKMIVARRDTSQKETIPLDEGADIVSKLLPVIQKNLLEKAKEYRVKNMHTATNLEEFIKIIDTTGGFIKTYWCENAICEAKVKEITKATIRCLPFAPTNKEGKCLVCEKPSTTEVIFARSY